MPVFSHVCFFLSLTVLDSAGASIWHPPAFLAIMVSLALLSFFFNLFRSGPWNLHHHHAESMTNFHKTCFTTSKGLPSSKSSQLMIPRRQRVKWISLVFPPKEIETNADAPAFPPVKTLMHQFERRGKIQAMLFVHHHGGVLISLFWLCMGICSAAWL